ncbi:TolC family protein [Aquincola sp. J276]|uniref:TolC family protein n=1 Tax=Aquincola sp. J276 TaxID=2898432 RepID=UPI002151FB8D|nr:TolC family protein [Aquincola sp. J276]MCR5869158.1 TolC family protein [Aquincola sp. J276]
MSAGRPILRAGMCPRHGATSAALAAAALLSGCAAFSPDAGIGPVRQTVQQRLGQPVQLPHTDAEQAAAQQQAQALLAQPLSADDAVRLALLNNRGLRAALHDVAIADAERVAAGRLPNPGFSFGRTRRGDEREIERGLHFSLGRLITLPLASEAATRRQAQAQAQVAGQALQLAHDTRRAWVQAVAAEEALHYSGQVLQAAQASAELARRMAQVGNFNALQQAREQAFSADAALAAARAQQARLAARERLVRLLGLWGEPAARLQLPTRLPPLPQADAVQLERPDIEQQAIAQRLDVQAARAGAQQLAGSLGLGRASRFVNLLELGVVRNSSNEEPTERGWELSLELPLFDGGAGVARAEGLYGQALHRAAETAVNARSEVREAYGAWRSAYDIARHQRDEVLPLQARIAEQNLLRYNGMLIGVFELLADARAQIGGVNTAIESLRDFWLAQADLDMALIGKPAAGGALPASSAAAAPAAEAGH